MMEAPPANAQKSETPFKDVVDLGIAFARAKGLDAANAEVAGRISLGLFFAETNGKQNAGNARSNAYKGSLQTSPSEDRAGQKKWSAIKKSINSHELIARDNKEEARLGTLDHRFNHWIAVRDGLANAHAELFLQIPEIVRTLPGPTDQMKLFELIQIIPLRPKPLSGMIGLPMTGFQTRESCDICETTASSRLDGPTEPRHLRLLVKSSVRCGYSIANLNERWSNSTRSWPSNKTILHLNWPQFDRSVAIVWSTRWYPLLCGMWEGVKQWPNS
jgi:hypothetical protein